MSKLDDLIIELCPNGVEYKTLKEVAEMKRGTSLTKANSREGEFPVISGGREPAFYCNQYNRDGETITVAGSGAGAGYVQYWTKKIFVCDAFSLKGNKTLSTKYLYYCLSNLQEQIYSTKKGGGVPHVHISSIENFKIPVPPLEIQCEIVRILDNFTELTAELTARKKQYEYYRDSLLTFNTEIPRVKLGDIATINRGIRVTRDILSENGKFPVYQNALSPLGFYDKSNRKSDTTFVISAGAAGQIGYSDVDFWSADDCFTFDDTKDIYSKYIYHFLKTKQNFIDSRVRRGSIPRISRDVFENLEIPLPPLEIQERIVNVLDNFDAICSDLKIGLPAEIDARKKQYEYYRDLLLRFEPLGTNIATHTHTHTR